MSPGRKSLKKELGLFDVFAVSTGAMFSSGFFLLPGLAAAKAGPSVVLAYLFAGILVLPAMFSKAELSTALPRAGGTYFFLDRSLGPMVGTVGGLGTYLALTLKSAFALIGIGAYAAVFIELPIKPIAVALTVVFMAVNIMGAKQTTALQRILVVILLGVLALFISQGFMYIVGDANVATVETQLTPFLPFGAAGLFSTIGFVFVSYAGLTKVASIAEEIRNPDRNIPLGMMLSLGVTTVVYVVGVFIMLMVLDPNELRSDLTPVATAAEAFFDWLPGQIGLMLIVAAALAAFASTGNAGLMSASRYPLAMARDGLLPARFAEVGRFHTPTPAILASGALMIACIVLLDVEGIAKLASVFQLFIFSLLCLAVIVMRESRIESYDPGFRSPLYPWIHILGLVVPMWIITTMGTMSILFSLGLIVLPIAWYFWYAADRVQRDGAIYHWFARLGQRRYAGLDRELRGILKEKGLRSEDPFDEVVARAGVIDAGDEDTYEDILGQAADMLSSVVPLSAEEIQEAFSEGTRMGATPVTHGVALPHFRVPDLSRPELVLVRSRSATRVTAMDPMHEHQAEHEVNAFFFLISAEEDPGQHLRLLAQVAGRVDDPGFMEQWLSAEDELELKEVLLSDERFLSLTVSKKDSTREFIGRPLREIGIPDGCLVAMISRDGDILIPRGHTVIESGDRLTIIGEPKGLETIREKYRS